MGTSICHIQGFEFGSLFGDDPIATRILRVVQLLSSAADELPQARYLMGALSNADADRDADLALAGIDLKMAYCLADPFGDFQG